MIARKLRALLAGGTALSLAFAASPAMAQLVRAGDLVDAIDSGGNGGRLAVTDVNPTRTDMTVLSTVVVANWNRFNAPANTTINITPTTGLPSATLVNRVIGSNFSDISGTINAPNINLWLINQNGILFGDGAAVNSASFFASTLDVSNSDLFDFYEGTNLTGNGANTLNFAGGLGGAITTTSPNVTFVTDGTLAFVSRQLNLDANFDAVSGRVSFVTAANVDVSFTPGSPLTYVVNAGTTVASSQRISGNVNANGVDFAMFTAAGVVGAVLRVDALVNANTAVATDTGIRLLASGDSPVSVFLDRTMTSSGLIDIDVNGELRLDRAISGSGIDVDASGLARFNNVTATAGDVSVTASAITAGQLSATGGDIDLASTNAITTASLSATGAISAFSTNSGPITLGDLTAGGLIDIDTFGAVTTGAITSGGALLIGDTFQRPSTLTMNGNVSAASVALFARDSIVAQDIEATAGNISLSAQNAANGGTIAAGNVLASGGINFSTGNLGRSDFTSLIAGGALTSSGTTTGAISVTGEARGTSVLLAAVNELELGDVTATVGTVILQSLRASVEAGNLSAGGSVTVVAASQVSDDPATEFVTIGNISAVNGNVTITAPGAITTGSLSSVTNMGSPRSIDVRSTAGGALDLGALDSDGNIALNTTAGIVTGSIAADGNLAVGGVFEPSAVTFNGNTSAASVTVDVTGAFSGQNLTANGGTIDIDADSISALALSATGGGATLLASGNVSTSAINVTGAIDVDSTAGGALNLGTLGSGAGITLDTTGNITTAAITAAGALQVGASSNPTAATFNGSIAATELSVDVLGGLTFGAANGVNSITGLSAGGAIAFENTTENLAITGLVTTGTNNVTIRNSGDLTLAAGGRINGGLVALSAGDRFINLRGSYAVSASDRWVVYSAAPAGNTFGNLDSGNNAIWNGTIDTVAPGSITGNRYVFAFQPTITVTSTDTNKVYGTDLTGALNGFFTVSGLQQGVAGAYLGDTVAGILSGAPLITSAGAVANADVVGGPYAMDISQGSLAATNGYMLAFDSAGRLTVTPKPIMGSVAADNKTYDGTTAGTGTVTLTGVIAGDTVGTAGTTFTFADRNAGVGKSVAVAGTTLTGADAGNYTLSVPASALADILARAITASVAADNKTYDGTTAGTGTVTLTGV
ncbi:MAG: beta strand repeat-containing protein, partial [Erythrobacter sp.]